MERKEKLLWKKLNVEITPNTHNLRMRRASTDGLPHFQIYGLSGNNGQDSEISSPTFKKPYSVKSEVQQELNQSFSFGQQMLQQIENFLTNSKGKYKNQMSNCHQQFDTFNSTQPEKTISKAIFIDFISKVSSFVSGVKLMMESIKLHFKGYNEYLESQKSFWENSINFIISQCSSKLLQEKEELKERIEKLNMQSYFSNERYKVLEKKSNSLEYQNTELMNSINMQRNSNQKLNKKIMELSEQYQKKIKQNSHLLELNCFLKSQISVLTQQTNHDKSLRLKTEFNNNTKSTLQTITPQKAKPFFTTKPDNRNSSISSSRIHNTSTFSRYCLPEFTESLTFSPKKNVDKFMNSLSNKKCDNNNYLSLKQNSKTSPQSFFFNDEGHPVTKKSILKEENSLAMRRKSTTNQRSALQLLNKSKDSEAQHINAKSELLFNRIKKLKHDIRLEIKDLRMESY